MSAAERMREAAAKACIALRDKWEADESHAPAAGAHICAAEILALPLPAPTPVEEAERAFCDAVECAAEMLGRWKRVVLGQPREDERCVTGGLAADDLAAAGRAVEARRLEMLAARQQERAEVGGDGR